MEHAVKLVVETTQPLTEDELFAVAEVAATVGDLGGTRMEAVFTVQASDTLQAAERAIRTYASVPGVPRGRVVAVDAMTAEENDRRCSEPPPAFVGITEIGELLGVSKQRVFQLLERDDFPAPYATLECGRIWRKGDLSRFAEGWQRKPGRPRLEEKSA